MSRDPIDIRNEADDLSPVSPSEAVALGETGVYGDTPVAAEKETAPFSEIAGDDAHRSLSGSPAS